MKEKHLIESTFEPQHKRTSENAKYAIMASDSAMLNPCAKRKKPATIEEQFSDNGWEIMR
jgi:hypothetical protein